MANKKQFNKYAGNQSKKGTNGRSGHWQKNASSKKGRFDKEKETAPELQKTNNPAWYMTNPALVSGVANIPFNVPMGDPVQMIDPSMVDTTRLTAGYQPTVGFPGICVVELTPSFGNQTDPGNSLNIAAQAIYTWVRYYNTGTRVYTPADLLIYLLAHGQIYSMINWAMRIYGTIKQFDHRNKYMSRYLLTMMRVDYTSFVGRLAEFRGRLNLLIDKAASFVVPDTMTYFERIASVYTDIYVDGTSIKDQMYMYNPTGFYKFKFDTSATPTHDGAYLEFVPIVTSPTQLLTVDDVLNYIEDAIDRVFYAGDQGIISGDFYKAYQGHTLSLKELSEDYITNIVHDDWVLNQMKNAVPVNYWNPIDLYQSNHTFNGFVTYDPTFTETGVSTDAGIYLRRALCGPRILTVKSDNPEVAHVMEFSRLMTQVKDPILDTNAGTFKCTYVVGENVVTKVRFGHFVWNNGVRSFNVIEESGYTLSASASGVSGFALLVSIRRCFPYAPQTIWTHTTSTTDFYCGLSNDVDNYTLLDVPTLQHIHEVALMNLFATDAVAKLK